jgi:hypothetical protein
MLTIFAVAAVVAVIAASVILMVGPEWVWSFFGPPDLGPVAFETLERRTTPNDDRMPATFMQGEERFGAAVVCPY